MNQQDQIYIDTIKNEITVGRYDHLFLEKLSDGTCLQKHELVFLDIGANIGLVSLWASPYCKRIVAVEPAPETFRQLQEYTKNYLVIEPYQIALASVDGFVPFFVNDINFTASSTVNTYGKQIMVFGRKLSTILGAYKLNHVDVCKVDCEGCEDEALSFDQLNNAKDIIDTFYIETHNCPKTTWEHKLGTLVGNLARCGYTKMTIDGMAITASK